MNPRAPWRPRGPVQWTLAALALAAHAVLLAVERLRSRR